jgi:hypothetical protein
MKVVSRLEWWLMDSLPDLEWARLRAFDDGTADVFDCGGKIHAFATLDDARNWLCEDEFVRLDRMEAQDLTGIPLRLEDLLPPRGLTEAELLPRMFQRFRLDEPELRKGILVSQHGGLSETACQELGCTQKSLLGMFLCVEHGYPQYGW